MNEYKNIRQLNGMTVADFSLELALQGHECVDGFGNIYKYKNNGGGAICSRVFTDQRGRDIEFTSVGKYHPRFNPSDYDLLLLVPDPIPFPSKDDVGLLDEISLEVVALACFNQCNNDSTKATCVLFMSKLIKQYAQQESKREAQDATH